MAHCHLAELPPDVQEGDEVVLVGDEAHHAAQVGRVRPGEELLVTDGRGTMCDARVLAALPREVRLEVTGVRRIPAPSPRIVLVQALAKGGRDELAIQSATELGVDAVVPWAASRSVSRWDGPKRDKGRDRWRAIVREASKQSLRAWIPEVRPLASTDELAALAGATMLVLDPTGDVALADAQLHGAGDVVLVVGPEGGIADAELQRLADAGAQRVRLGAEVLRTSTAGPSAIAVLAVRLGRWS